MILTDAEIYFKYEQKDIWLNIAAILGGVAYVAIFSGILAFDG